MMRRLIILLLIVGCEEYAPTNHTHIDTGETFTDTLFVYDTLIVTNYDTTIFNNYDTLIITNYDTTIVYDTLVVVDTVYIDSDDVYGCTIEDACNYNPDANIYNGNCDFTTCAGCMDTLAFNYDVNALIEGDCSYGISGQLKDNNGDNVENAAILLTYDLGLENLNRINMPCTSLYYSLPQSSDVYLWIESMCGDTINVIVDEYRDAGSYFVTWCADDLNGNTVVDGNYIAHLITNGSESNQNTFLLQYDFSELESIGSQNYHAMTDNNGIFRIPFDCLSFGIEHLGMDAFGNPTDNIVVPYKTQVWIIHDDYPTFSTDWYEVDPNNGVFLNIDLPNP